MLRFRKDPYKNIFRLENLLKIIYEYSQLDINERSSLMILVDPTNLI